jgi:PhoH-like ATPase
MPKKKTIFHAALVPALDALIGDPKLLEPDEDTKLKAKELIIPTQFVHRIRDFRDEQSSRGEASTKLLGSFSRIFESIHYSEEEYYTCKNGMKIRFVRDDQIKIANGESKKSSTVHTLATARYYYDAVSHDVAILTGDNYMMALALSNDIDVARVNPEVYTGRRKLIMPDEAYRSWFGKTYLTEDQFLDFFPDEKPLLPNEFVEFSFDHDLLATYRQTNGTFDYKIGRFEATKEGGYCLQQLHYINNLPHYIRPRTAGQAMLAEALMAPVDEIPIVICPSVFGTGKTYLATAIGLFLVAEKNPHYDRIFICPRDSELGKEIGFLPGDEREKTLAKAMPIVDNIRAYVKNKGDKKPGGQEMDNQSLDKQVDYLIEKHFELVSIINMGGRSISDSWILYDEAQDMERFQINQLMKRIGDGSKMIVTGDPHQVYNRHMNYHSNGLSYAAVKMAGSPYAAVITMDESEITRSTAAREIARCLDH